MKSLILIILIATTTALAGCNQMQAARGVASLNDPFGSVANSKAFSNFRDIVEPNRSTDPNDVAYTSTSIPTSPPISNTCANAAGVMALADAIRARAGSANWSSQFNVNNNSWVSCQAILLNYAAKSGSVAISVTADPTQAIIGADCVTSSTPANTTYGITEINLMTLNLLQGDPLFLCAYGTDPNNCSPSSPDFIAELTYTWGTNTAYNLTEAIFTTVQTANGTFNNVCQDVGVSMSPLVIEKVSGHGIFTLDPNATNTNFDLSGSGHKDKISCVQNGAFLALPDSSGNIVNINQLFGNNTVGPDGKKADNGFLALGKYDHKPVGGGYGMISPTDAIFSKLRLWEDKNCDGIAQASEVSKLTDWGISSIRWLNAIEIDEADPYGNQTLYRNYVYTTNGSVLKSFDVWFLMTESL